MFAWTVGVSLVLTLLLIWSALYRDSLRTKNARIERSSAHPERGTAEWREPAAAADAPAAADHSAERAAKQTAGK